LVAGQIPVDRALYRVERPSRSVPREKREPQAGVASGLSNAASIIRNAGGDVVWYTEPKMSVAAPGEAASSLTGSESVARVEGDTRNWGGPSASRHSRFEDEPGKLYQRQEGELGGYRGRESDPGIREWGRRRVGTTQRLGRIGEAGKGHQGRMIDGINLANLPAGEEACRFEEPSAGILHAGICEGGTGQPVSLPRQLPVVGPCYPGRPPAGIPPGCSRRRNHR
jgi:hypothetical protein